MMGGASSAVRRRHASGTQAVERPSRILHVLDHSLPLHRGCTFHTLAILGQQCEERIDGWTFRRNPLVTGLATKLSTVVGLESARRREVTH